MTKRILPLLLAALLLLSLLPQLTLPAAAAASSGSCGDKLKWSFNSNTGVLTITGSGDMTISGIDAPWAGYKDFITSVSLPNGLSSIGRYAFYSCSKLTAISFPSTLKTIGDHAFQYCTGLKSLSIPDGVTKISYSAFSNCSALVNVKLPSNLSTIPSLCFASCASLQTVTFPKKLTTIGGSAFGECSGLVKISLPAGLSLIESTAFQDCSGLNEVNFPEGLTEIDMGAFMGCTALKSVTIPKSVSIIEAGALGWKNTSRKLDGFTIRGYANTAAQTYAKANSFKFVDLSATPTDPTDPTEPTKPNPFVDVPSGSYFYNPVIWAYYHTPQITAGTNATHFSPMDTCTRAQVVTFLWRAAGQPNPGSTSSPFVDVQNPNNYYYKAVLWAVEKGITNGTSATRFSPNDACTRGQVVTFLWRATGKNAPNKTGSPFVDVKDKNASYYTAVLWAYYHDPQITNGTDTTHFSPSKSCTRSEVVTFLYRHYANQ